MYHWRIALRNLFRNKRRTFFTGFTMFGSFVLCSMTMGLINGTYGFVINQFTLGHSGHIQIHANGYWQKPSLQNTIKNPDQIINKIKQTLNKADLHITSRLESAGLLFYENRTEGVRIVAIDPILEKETTRFLQQIKYGKSWQESTDLKGIVLSKDLFDRLQIVLNQDLILMSQGADGSIANSRLKVIGMIDGSDSTVYMNLSQAYDFFSAKNMATDLVLTFADYSSTESASKILEKKFPDLEIHPWQMVEEEFYRAMKSDQSAIFLTMGIFMFLAAFGVLNTVLMAILERTRELGVMRALGLRHWPLIKIILLEQVILGFTMSILGAFVSSGLNIYLSKHGIPYPKPIEIGGMTFHSLYGHLDFNNLFYPFLIVFLSASIVSFIPAIRANRIPIVEALRER